MKQIITTTLLTLMISFAQAITPPDSTASLVDKAAAGISINEGKNLYFQGNVRGALIKFREALAKNNLSANANYWIAECQYRLHNYGIALKYCNNAVKLNQKVNKDIYILMGKAHHRMGHLDSAISVFNKAKEVNSKSNINFYRLDYEKSCAEYAKNNPNNSQDVQLSKMPEPVNSKFHDYSPVLAPDGKTLYFTSRRNNTTGGTVNEGDNIFFEDIYYVKWNDSKESWGNASNKLERINTSGHESIAGFSNDGMKMFLTVNDESENIPKKNRKYKSKSGDICVAMKTDQGGWNKPKLVSKGAQTSFYEGAQSVTDDGLTMYYASDKKGGNGSVDIYVMTSEDGKKWSSPKNLGKVINTKFKETTPIISGDGKYLFFASDGHIGYGGLDIFVAENLGDGKWSKPVNLGKPINSVNDDTHFRYYKKLKKAFMARMELDGKKASRDIFEIDMTNFKMPKFEEPTTSSEKK